MHLVLTPHDLAPEQSYNVIADLKGDEIPKEIVVVSGHLDSWDLGTGALARRHRRRDRDGRCPHH